MKRNFICDWVTPDGIFVGSSVIHEALLNRYTSEALITGVQAGGSIYQMATYYFHNDLWYWLYDIVRREANGLEHDYNTWRCLLDPSGLSSLESQKPAGLPPVPESEWGPFVSASPCPSTTGLVDSSCAAAAAAHPCPDSVPSSDFLVCTVITPPGAKQALACVRDLLAVHRKGRTPPHQQQQEPQRQRPHQPPQQAAAQPPQPQILRPVPWQMLQRQPQPPRTLVPLLQPQPTDVFQFNPRTRRLQPQPQLPRQSETVQPMQPQPTQVFQFNSQTQCLQLWPQPPRLRLQPQPLAAQAFQFQPVSQVPTPKPGPPTPSASRQPQQAPATPWQRLTPPPPSAFAAAANTVSATPSGEAVGATSSPPTPPSTPPSPPRSPPRSSGSLAMASMLRLASSRLPSLKRLPSQAREEEGDKVQEGADVLALRWEHCRVSAQVGLSSPRCFSTW